MEDDVWAEQVPDHTEELGVVVVAVAGHTTVADNVQDIAVAS